MTEMTEPPRKPHPLEEQSREADFAALSPQSYRINTLPPFRISKSKPTPPREGPKPLPTFTGGLASLLSVIIIVFALSATLGGIGMIAYGIFNPASPALIVGIVALVAARPLWKSATKLVGIYRESIGEEERD